MVLKDEQNLKIQIILNKYGTIKNKYGTIKNK